MAQITAVPQLKGNNGRQYVESLFATTAAVYPAKLLIGAMRRIEADLLVKDAPLYTGQQDWTADDYVCYVTTLQNQVEAEIDEEEESNVQLQMMKYQMSILEAQAGLMTNVRSPGNLSTMLVGRGGVDAKRRKVLEKAETWLFGTVAATIAGYTQSADLFLRVKTGRGLKLFSVTIQMLVRKRRHSEQEYRRRIVEAPAIYKTLANYTAGLTKELAIYNFYVEKRKEIGREEAIERYYEGIEKLGHGTLRVNLEAKMGKNCCDLILLGIEAKTMAQRLGITWGKIQTGGDAAFAGRETGNKRGTRHTGNPTAGRSGNPSAGSASGGGGNPIRQRVERCFKCGSKDHLAFDCPHEKSKCFKCGEFCDHIAKDCPLTEEQANQKKRERWQARRKQQQAQVQAAVLQPVANQQENGSGWANRLPPTGK